MDKGKSCVAFSIVFCLSMHCLYIAFALSLHCLSIGFAVIVEEGSKFLALSQVVFSLESRFAPLC